MSKVVPVVNGSQPSAANGQQLPQAVNGQNGANSEQKQPQAEEERPSIFDSALLKVDLNTVNVKLGTQVFLPIGFADLATVAIRWTQDTSVDKLGLVSHTRVANYISFYGCVNSHEGPSELLVFIAKEMVDPAYAWHPHHFSKICKFAGIPGEKPQPPKEKAKQPENKEELPPKQPVVPVQDKSSVAQPKPDAPQQNKSNVAQPKPDAPQQDKSSVAQPKSNIQPQNQQVVPQVNQQPAVLEKKDSLPNKKDVQPAGPNQEWEDFVNAQLKQEEADLAQGKARPTIYVDEHWQYGTLSTSERFLVYHPKSRKPYQHRFTNAVSESPAALNPLVTGVGAPFSNDKFNPGMSAAAVAATVGAINAIPYLLKNVTAGIKYLARTTYLQDFKDE